jgi:hypothetical protein
MKMALDGPTMAYDLLGDVEILLSLVCFIPMLENVNSLVKFVQFHNVFVCDFVATMKKFQTNLQNLYIFFGFP